MWTKGKTIEDVLVIGEEEGGLYKLKGHPETTLVHDITSSSELWHIKYFSHQLQRITLCGKGGNGFTIFEYRS